MFKFITLIFLTVHVALVLGIMTKDDIPEEIQNCLDNVLIPGFQLRREEAEKCNLNADGCRSNEEIWLNESNDEKECQNKIYDLEGMERKFTKAYWTNEELKIVKVDFSSELPENMRNCIDSIKPALQAYYQSARDCEAFIRTDDSEMITADNSKTQDPYEECLDKIPNVFKDPVSLKCNEILRTLTNDQHRLLNPYMWKVVFDF